MQLEIGQRWQRIPNCHLIIEVLENLSEDSNSCQGKVLYPGDSKFEIGKKQYCSGFRFVKSFWKLLPNQDKP